MRPGADVLRLRALEAYHDGELRGLARLRLERHLARSPELRLELEALRALRARLRERDEGGPAPDLWPGIEARLAAATLPAERPRSLPRRLVAPIGALAAAAARLRSRLSTWVRSRRRRGGWCAGSIPGVRVCSCSRTTPRPG